MAVTRVEAVCAAPAHVEIRIGIKDRQIGVDGSGRDQAVEQPTVESATSPT
jgi:hypothetical protein